MLIQKHPSAGYNGWSSDYPEPLLVHARIIPQSCLRELLPLQDLLTLNLSVTRAEVYVMTPCCLVRGYQRVGGMHCVYVRSRLWMQHLSIYLSVYLSIYLSMALQSFCWTLAALSVSESYTQAATTAFATTEEPSDAVFYILSVSYQILNMWWEESRRVIPFGGGVKYLHCRPASYEAMKREPSAWGYNRTTLFRGDINTETWSSRLRESRYESRWTGTRVWLHWRDQQQL
jgi:hypothetical protein